MICLSWSACTSNGKTVPVSTTSANAAKSRLLSRNAASRDNGESIRPGDRNASPRHAISPTPTAAVMPRNVNNHGPIDDSVAITDLHADGFATFTPPSSAGSYTPNRQNCRQQLNSQI